MPTLTIRVSEKEVAVMKSAMLARGDETLSGHVRAVYMEAMQGDAAQRAEIVSLLKAIDGKLVNQQKKRGDLGNETLQTLIACLYLMARRSAPLELRGMADAAINLNAIENYVKGEGA
jgi:hypothetical protein